ncbi:MAG: hypothetical protein NWF05_06535 [Candidatus Bathyarchaeota archaeon]|nr:hypothetical protein [Candidatus Bathyarchaeota archaeon]
MKRHSNAILAVIVTCGLLLACFSLAETVSSSPSGVSNSDVSWVTAANSPTPTAEFTVLKSNSTLSEPIFNRTSSEVTFTVTGPSGTSGYVWCKIAENLIPHENVDKNVKVLIDGNQISYMHTFDDGAWELYFNYMHSTHQVTIGLPKENTIFGIDSLTFAVVLAALCVILGTTIAIWHRKQKPMTPHQ